MALIALLALTGGTLPTAAEKIGSEFRVNLTTQSAKSASVARLSRGGFVVTWTSIGPNSPWPNVHGQRYSAAGAPIGGQFRANSVTQLNQSDPSVAGLANGSFVVVWHSQHQDAYGGYGVFGRLYDAAGAPVGEDFQINTYTADSQMYPAVAALKGGGFVVTWLSQYQDSAVDFGIFGQQFSAQAKPVGREFQVNTYDGADQLYPSIAGLSDGGFAIVWQSKNQDGSSYGIYGQRYNAAGARVGAEFRINTFTDSRQEYPSIAGLSGGGFVVVWQSYQDGSDTGIYAQRYTAAGARIGGEFRVNSYTIDSQRAPSVAGLSDGGFVVAWESFGQNGAGYDVYAKVFPAKTRLQNEFRVNTTTAENQFDAFVASLNNNSFIIAWSSRGTREEVYGQRFSVDSAPKITLDPVSQTVRSGQTVTFSADASGAPSPSVQWQVSTNGGSSFTNIAGATAKTLSFATNTRQNGNQYRAVFANSAGSATTKAATLTVTLFGKKIRSSSEHGTAGPHL